MTEENSSKFRYQFDEEEMHLTSFSNLKYADQSHTQVSDGEEPPEYISSEDSKEDDARNMTKRWLYTIVEDHESEMTRTGLMRAENWTNLESCGLDLENELEAASKGATTISSPIHSVESAEECDEFIEKLFEDSAVISLGEKSESSEAGVSENSNGGEIRMFPNITDDEKKVGNIYSTFYLRQRTKHVQCDIRDDKDCQKCSFLESEISRISKLLKKAEAEIDYLNDEFRIMTEEKRHETGCKNQTMAPRSTSKLENHYARPRHTIHYFIRWMFMGVWGLPGMVLRWVFSG
jgi:hypothetical protein